MGQPAKSIIDVAPGARIGEGQDVTVQDVAALLVKAVDIECRTCKRKYVLAATSVDKNAQTIPHPGIQDVHIHVGNDAQQFITHGKKPVLHIRLGKGAIVVKVFINTVAKQLPEVTVGFEGAVEHGDGTALAVQAAEVNDIEVIRKHPPFAIPDIKPPYSLVQPFSGSDPVVLRPIPVAQPQLNNQVVGKSRDIKLLTDFLVIGEFGKIVAAGVVS